MKNRDAGAAIRGTLQKLGVIRESGHEHFTGSVVIPVFDEAGQVTGMYGRKITALRPFTGRAFGNRSAGLRRFAGVEPIRAS
jgi:hypothetical protein